MILAEIVTLEVALLLLHVKGRLIPHYGDRSVNPLVHQAKVIRHGNILEPLEPDHTTVLVDFLYVYSLCTVEFIVKVL
jgi:hypothetical protein